MTQAAVGSNVVVVLPPAGEDLSGVVQVQEPMLRQALTPQASVEGFNVTVVHRLARAAEVQPDPVPVGPVVERFRGELAPIVHRDALRQLASTLSRFTQDAADVFCAKGRLGHQRHALPREDVHHRQDPDRAAVRQHVVHEVHRPALVGSRDERPHLANGRALAPLRPPPLERQPLFPVQPVDQLVIDTPALSPQQHGEPLEALGDPHRGQLPQPTAQRHGDLLLAESTLPHGRLSSPAPGIQVRPQDSSKRQSAWTRFRGEGQGSSFGAGSHSLVFLDESLCGAATEPWELQPIGPELAAARSLMNEMRFR